MKLIYKSEYTRGLEILLKMWPEIKNRIPDATLDIYYGWGLIDLYCREDINAMSWKEKMLKLMTQDGITEYGRVSKQELDQATALSDIWAYPTTVGETNCISALDSQKLGCVPVTMAFAGLLDTVYSGVLIEGDINDENVQVKFLEELIHLWNDKDKLNKEKEKGIEGITNFAWPVIAKKWECYF